MAARVIRRLAHRKNIIEVFALMLAESVRSHRQVVFPEVGIKRSLQAAIIGRLVHVGDHRNIVRRGVIARLIVMVEGRNSQEQIRIIGVNPGEGYVTVGLAFAVAKTVTGELLIPGELGSGS